MLATKPTAARRPPARALVLIAELDFDDVVDDGLDPELEGFFVVELEGEDDDDEFADGVPSAAEALAFAWNSSNVSFAGGFTANTWPFWQWPVWAQWNHNAVVSLMVIVNESGSVELSGTGSKPESMPSVSGRHGALKFDCVTEWLLEGKMNVIVSLGWAVTLVGLKAPGSSVTWMSAADAEVAAPMARIAEARAKCIFKKILFCWIVYGRAGEQILLRSQQRKRGRNGSRGQMVSFNQ
jgi:hypothetical protein